MIPFGRLIRALCAAVLVAVAPVPAALAQGSGAGAEAQSPDYVAWETTAKRAEALVADADASDEDLNQARTQIADWRSALSVAQNTNSTRIATLRAQIDALGPAPGEGQPEAPEIATRRTQLTGELVQLQAPGIAADEAYRRADGLIREIDRILRDRQAEELLRLWPSPINPANWPAGVKALTDTAGKFWVESKAEWNRPQSKRPLEGKLPLILLLVAVGLMLILRGRQVMQMLSRGLRARVAPRWHKIWSLVLSIGQVILPTIGFMILQKALVLTSLLGPVGVQFVDVLPAVGFTIFAAVWLGGRVFPKVDYIDAPFVLSPEQRAEGRVHVTGFGLLIGLDALRNSVVLATGAGDVANSVLTFPIIVVASVLLFRTGNLLRRHVANDAGTSEQTSFRNRLIGVFGRGAEIIGVVGPVLAAIGYVPAAGALVEPAAISLALLGLIFVLQNLVDNIYALIAPRDETQGDPLAPTLIGFVLILASLPVFALIWGMRPADLSELWIIFLGGFSIGATQISPTDFMIFALVFGIGYMITRLVQGALRASVLPKTRLDQGGQNAILAGLGYVGVFLAALAAINAAGINLAGLAIVAGALSVGIGFGLQNIVSNFVSGIILLIERPVSEGDWIEVGGVQGVVKAISVRSTRIQTFDRTDVIVPNTDLIAGQVTNWTRYNLTGRLIVPVSVGYDADTQQVARILTEIAEAQPLVVLNPAPVAVFMGLGADVLNFEIRMILRDVNFSLSIRSDVNHEIIRRFREAKITLPAPQRPTVTQHGTHAAPHVMEAPVKLHGTHRDEVQDADSPDPEDAR